MCINLHIQNASVTSLFTSCNVEVVSKPPSLMERKGGGGRRHLTLLQYNYLNTQFYGNLLKALQMMLFS